MYRNEAKSYSSYLSILRVEMPRNQVFHLKSSKWIKFIYGTTGVRSIPPLAPTQTTDLVPERY